MEGENMLDTKVSLLNIEHCVFEWGIENFFFSDIDPDFKIRTKSFKIDPCSQVMWYLIYIPRLAEKKISVHLVRDNDDGPINVGAHIIVKISFNGIVYLGKKKFLSFKKGSNLVISIISFEEEIRHFVANDTLLIKLDVYTLSDKALRQTKKFPPSFEMASLSLDLKAFKLMDDFNDVTFKLAECKTAKANKTILSCRSQYFKNKLETTSIIDWPDVDNDTFQCLLNFIYTGEYELSSFQKVSLHSLFQYAEQLGLKELVELLQPNKIVANSSIEAERIEFIWETDFDLTSENPNSNFVMSVPFGSCFCETRWTVKLHKKTKRYISMALDCCSPTKDSFLATKISLINKKEEPLFTYECIKSMPSYGRLESPKFIDQKLLPDSGVLHDNKVRILCQLKFASKDAYEKINFEVEKNILSKPLCWPNGYNCLSNDFKILYDTHHGSDLTIKCDDKKYHVHKCILIARNLELPEEITEPNESEVAITGTDAATFEKFLKLVYTGVIDFENLENDSKTVLKLLDLSEDLCMPLLKEKCTKIIKSKLRPEAVCDLLSELSDTENLDIKAMVVEYVCANACTVMFTEQWQTLLKNKREVAEEVVLLLEKTFKRMK